MHQLDLPSAIQRPHRDQVSALLLLGLCDQAVREDAKMLCMWHTNRRDLQQVRVFVLAIPWPDVDCTPHSSILMLPTLPDLNRASRIIEKMNAKQERIKRQKEERRLELEGLVGIEGLETRPSADQGLEDEEQGSERSFYEDE